MIADDDSRCSGKRKYISFHEAQRGARSLNRSGRKMGKLALQPYHCLSCKFFHVGNNIKKGLEYGHRKDRRLNSRRAQLEWEDQ